MKIRSICSSGLLPKHALIKWMSMDLLVLWHWFCKIIFISFKTSTGKKVLCFVELLNMFTYTKKKHYLFYERIQSNTNLTQSDKTKLPFFSRFSPFKNFMGCLLPITFPVWILFKINLKHFCMKCKISNSPLGSWTFMQCKWVENDIFEKFKSCFKCHIALNIKHFNPLKLYYS